MNAVGLGTARWSIGDEVDDRAAVRFLHDALDLGIDHLDTARAYTTPTHESHSETLIARVLAERDPADRPLVATKGGHHRDGHEWRVDGRPSTLRRHCDASLRALGVDVLDLYYLHKPDPDVPLEDSVGALAELRDRGKVRAVGLSNVSVGQLDASRAITPIAAVQNPFSPDAADPTVLRRCADLGIAFVAYSPLGGTRRSAALTTLSPTAAAVAESAGETIATVWLAWVLAHSPVVALLTGARRPESLRASLRAASLPLDDDTRDRITLDLETA